MSRKRKLTVEQEEELFRMSNGNYSNKEIAKRFNIGVSTVGKYRHRAMVRHAREAEERGDGERVVSEGDGFRLTHSVDGGYVGRFEVGGAWDERAFAASDDGEAEAMFDRWRSEMQGERDEYDRMYGDGRWRERAEALEAELAERDAEVAQLTAANETLGRELDGMRARVAELESRPSGPMPDTIYAVLVEKPSVKGFGYYTDMDAACAKVAEMNEMAAWLGNPDSIDVHELQRRE